MTFYLLFSLDLHIYYLGLLGQAGREWSEREGWSRSERKGRGCRRGERRKLREGETLEERQQQQTGERGKRRELTKRKGTRLKDGGMVNVKGYGGKLGMGKREIRRD